MIPLQCAGLGPACGRSKHGLIYERTLLLRHASKQLLPLPVSLLCRLRRLVSPEVFLQGDRSKLRSGRNTLNCSQWPCGTSENMRDYCRLILRDYCRLTLRMRRLHAKGGRQLVVTSGTVCDSVSGSAGK